MNEKLKRSARRRRFFEEVLDSSHILTDLRRDLQIFCTTMLGIHQVIGRITSDPERAYISGMHTVVERLQGILRKKRKPDWQNRWNEERRQRKAAIFKIQRRPEWGTVRIRLLPEPECEEDLERFADVRGRKTA